MTFWPPNRDWYQRLPNETYLEAWVISHAEFKTHRVAHYALILTFWYSRKRFYHYTECIDSLLRLLGASPPEPLLVLCLCRLYPSWGHSLQTPSRPSTIWIRQCAEGRVLINPRRAANASDTVRYAVRNNSWCGAATARDLTPTGAE